MSPLDATLGLREHDRTPAADEVVYLAGLMDAFATGASTLLRRMTGLVLSESTVQRATEDAGTRAAADLHANRVFGPATLWDWHRDAEGKTVGYVSVDATDVGQQAPGGRRADGKMAYVGTIYNPVPEAKERWSKPTENVRSGKRGTRRRCVRSRTWPNRCGDRRSRSASITPSVGSRSRTAARAWKTSCG
ncbi:MAG: hypothetical protein U0791_09890 [Gemmataceae bacterium]